MFSGMYVRARHVGVDFGILAQRECSLLATFSSRLQGSKAPRLQGSRQARSPWSPGALAPWSLGALEPFERLHFKNDLPILPLAPRATILRKAHPAGR